MNQLKLTFPSDTNESHFIDYLEQNWYWLEREQRGADLVIQCDDEEARRLISGAAVEQGAVVRK